MASVSVLSPRHLAAITRIPCESLSRTGRHEAVTSGVRPAALNATPASSPAAAAGSSPAAAASPGAAPRQKRSKKSAAEVVDETALDFEVEKALQQAQEDDEMQGEEEQRQQRRRRRQRNAGVAAESESASVTPKTRRVARDAEARADRDLRSSPHSHPLRETFERRAYECSRLRAFEQLAQQVSSLPLVDEEGVAAAVARRHGASDGRQELADIDSLETDGETEELRGTEGEVEVADAAEREKAVTATATTTTTSAAACASGGGGADKGPHEELRPTRPAAAAVGVGGGPTNESPSPPRSHRPAATARGGRQAAPHESAAFLSPQRWRKSPTRPSVPPVGHYRPKFGMTQCSVPGGYITSPRCAAVREKCARGFTVLPSVLAARDRVQREEAEAATRAVQHLTEPDSPLSQNEEPASPTLRGQCGPPQPSRCSTWVFKSKAPQCESKLFSAAPDRWYWPLVDTGSTKGSTPRGQVRFDRQCDRKPLAIPLDTPDAYYKVGTSVQSARGAVSMQKQTPRLPTRAPLHTELPFYDTARADAVTRPHCSIVDFGSCSPRKDIISSARNSSSSPLPAETTADCVAKAKHVPTLNFERLRARPPLTTENFHDLTYEPCTTQTSPRERGAVIRADSTGHQPLFHPSITDSCDYSPKLDSVRPKVIRAVDFALDTPRKPQLAAMHDLVYDVKNPQPSGKRVVGNPMIASHMNRDKREKLLSPRKVQTEIGNMADFNLDKVREVHKGAAVDFGKQVTKETHFAGRGIPSDRWSLNHPTAPPPGTYDWQLK